MHGCGFDRSGPEDCSHAVRACFMVQIAKHRRGIENKNSHVLALEPVFGQFHLAFPTPIFEKHIAHRWATGGAATQLVDQAQFGC